MNYFIFKSTTLFLLMFYLVLPSSFVFAGPAGLAVTTDAVSDITTTTATFNGTITNVSGGNATSRGFEYGIDGFGTTTTETGSFDLGSFSAAITGLECGTTYSVRAYASAGSTVTGSDAPFTTDDCVPTIVTGAASDVTTTSATLAGSLTNTGGQSPTIRGFQYGTSTSYGSTVSESGTYGVGYVYQSQFGSHGEKLSGAINASLIAIDSDDHIYIYDIVHHKIVKYTTSGTYLGSSAATATGTGAGEFGFGIPQGMAIDPTGTYLYFIDQANHRIEKFDTATGNYVSEFGSFGSDEGGQFSVPGAITVDASGDIYVADNSQYRIQKFDANGNFIFTIGWSVATSDDAFEICSISSNCEVGHPGSGDGQFQSFGGLTTDSAGNLYVSESTNGRVQVFDSDGNYLSQFGSIGSGDGEFPIGSAQGIVVDGSGNSYVVDAENDRVQKFNAAGSYQSQFGSSSNLSSAVNVARDSLGNFYITDFGNHYIAKYNSSGTFVTSFGAADELIEAAEGLFHLPNDIAQDSMGNVYVIDFNNDRIQKFNSAGVYQFEIVLEDASNNLISLVVDASDNLYALTVTSGYANISKYDSNGNYISGFDSEASEPENFLTAYDMAMDSFGNFYIIDGYDRVAKYNSAGVYQSEFGSEGFGEGQFDSSSSIAIDSLDNIYVLNASIDGGDDHVQKFNSEGVYQSVFGTKGSGDGEFSLPREIAIDADGTIVVGDTNQHRIQIFSPDGTYLSQFGSYGNGDGELFGLQGLSVDVSGGVLYVSDGADRIQKFLNNADFTLDISSLGCGTYHYRAFATNGVGTGYGDDETFVTTACPESEQETPPQTGSTSSGYLAPKIPVKILESGLCPADLIIIENLKQGARNGNYNNYTRHIVKQVAILQAHINRILASQYNQAAGPVDGIFGPLTKQGVVRLQMVLNETIKPSPHLIIDGIVGQYTKTAINNSCGNQ